MAGLEVRTAALMDGRTAARRPAILWHDGQFLHLATEGQEAEVLAPELLRWLERSPARTILARTDMPDWRLSAEPGLPPDWLRAVRGSHQWEGRTALRWGAGIAAALGVCALLWVRGGPVLDAAAVHVPDAVTRPIGESLVEGLSRMGRCDTPEARTAIDSLLARLEPEEGHSEPITVTVVDWRVANALAAPGGQVVLTRGLLETADGPDEVAGVLAHELGHIAHRHMNKALLRAFGMSLLLSSVGGNAGAMADSLLTNALSRDDEREADAYALTTLERAGVSAAGLAAFFERNMRRGERAEDAGQAESGAFGRIGSYTSTHPPSPERLAVIRAAVLAEGETRPALDGAQWAALRQVCGGES
ncbi:MAG: M48 family metallopeptidase [Thermaurantiacus sp.]